jgi:hypothetical protein
MRKGSLAFTSDSELNLADDVIAENTIHCIQLSARGPHRRDTPLLGEDLE